VVSRGDVVVVERAAAEFFEARVLSVSGSTLKVEPAGEAEPVKVERSDVYALPPEAHRFSAGDPAICNDGPSHWAACRIVEVASGALRVLVAGAAERTLTPDRVLTPTPVTALDVDRLFASFASRQRFRDAVRAAGEPRRPGTWSPSPREPVLARRRAEWYSAHAVGLVEDGGVRVAWDGSERPETLPGAGVVPVPPFPHPFAAGEFALAPPPSPAEPWKRVRVEAVGASEAVVLDESGARQRVDVQKLVPLSGGPGSIQ
jgi:hypothetical protein